MHMPTVSSTPEFQCAVCSKQIIRVPATKFDIDIQLVAVVSDCFSTAYQNEAFGLDHGKGSKIMNDFRIKCNPLYGY